jgi:osmotically-inducible protein OsmY
MVKSVAAERFNLLDQKQVRMMINGKYSVVARMSADLAISIALCLLLSPAGFPQSPDNTKTNQRDRQSGAVTADQQAENKADRDLASKIRKSITDDKNMSTYARNVKVIASNGTVVLKGPVRSGEEKSAIEAKAAEIAGAGNVKNELTVKEKSQN